MLLAIGASLLVAVVSLVGILFFGIFERLQEKTHYMVSLSIGVFLGIVFTDLIPEALEHSPHMYGGLFIVIGFLFFFVLSHSVTHYHHHHEEHACDTCATGSMILIGDSIHNFVDGVIIAGAFLVNPMVGIATTLGIIFHELPQEIAEFFVLIKSGYTRTRALVLNFISALSVIAGTVLAYLFLSSFESIVGPLLGIAAGNLLYIAGSDLIPELTEHHKHSPNHSRVFWKQFLLIVLGVCISTSIVFIAH